MAVLARTNHRLYWRVCAIPGFLVIISLFPTLAPAAQWSLEPSLQIEETYTDNISYTEPSEEEYITEVNPAVAFRAKARRLNADFSYRLQNLYYAKDSDRNTQFHNLGAAASAEIIKDFGFLNLSASDSQRVVSPSRGLPLDNLNTANRTDVSARAINPYIKQRFGRSAEASASYSYESVHYDKGVSDAIIEATNIGLQSGPAFQRLTWSLGYLQKSTSREEASNYSQESSFIQTDYRVNRVWGILFRAGRENDDLATSQNRGFRNGSYYAGGVRIQPHSTLRFDFLAGTSLNSASVYWELSPRSTVDISWRDQKVGLNPGKVWQGTVKLVSRKTIWSASYLEDTTSVQGVQSLGGNFQQSGSIVLNQSGNQTASSQTSNLSNTAFSLSNDLFLRKRADINFGYRTTKSNIDIALYSERREYFAIDDVEKIHGGNLSWRWRFATRTNMILRHQNLKNYYRASIGGGVGRLRSTDLGFTRQMGAHAEGIVMARKTSQDGLVGGRRFDEKRLSVSMRWFF